MEKGIAACAKHASPDLEHVVVCLTTSGSAEGLFPHGTRIFEIKKPPGNSLRTLGKLAKQLRSLSPCVLHTRNWAGTDGVIAGRLAGITSILHGEHGWDVDDLHGESRKRRFIRRQVSGFTAGFTRVSKQIADWLARTVKVRCGVTQIYNGVDTDAFRPSTDDEGVRQELGLSQTTRLIGHVGRLVAVKNHDALLRSFDVVRRDIKDTVLLCLGDGPRELELRALAGPDVRFLGHRTDISRMLRAVDLFVLPSLNEGISNTVLEAMASGVPVIATDVGGNSELIVDDVTGSLIPAGDDRALADAIRRLLSNDQVRKEQGRTAREVVLRRFTLKAMVQAYEHAWRDCARRASI